MEFTDLLILIVCMMLVTAAPRVVPVALLSGRKMPAPLVAWLRFVPVAILSALLACEIAWRDDHVALGPASSLMIPVAVLSFFVAARTRSLFGTVAFGMGALAML